MPIYEYTCRDCGNDFEKLVRSPLSSDEVECPSCRSKETKKKLSTFASKSSGGSAGYTSAAACSPGGG